MFTPRLFNIFTSVLASASLAQMVSAALMFSGAEGTREAQVTFEVNGDDLIITLANTSGFDVTRPSELLTGVFFDLTTQASDDGHDESGIELESAMIQSPNVVLFGSAGPNGNVGSEWAFVSALEAAPGGASYGISSTGLGLFGPKDLADDDDDHHPHSPSPGGMGFGITSRSDDPSVGNRAVTGQNPLIQYSVTFVLDDLPDGLSESDIGNVWVQYGTSMSEPSISVVVPTPGSLALFGIGTLLIARRRTRPHHA